MSRSTYALTTDGTSNIPDERHIGFGKNPDGPTWTILGNILASAPFLSNSHAVCVKIRIC